ncbi:MAG: DUF4296 domain-containing protein [Flavobacteriia bacterium]|nr:DUF4296 domain-containing protein [Flavobacteriia bacterium]
MKNFLIIIFILVIQSCSDGSKLKRTDVISTDDMVKILTQRQLIVSQLNTFQYQGDFSKFHVDSLISDCYLSLGYSEDDFDKSWNYYTTDANEELLVIYDKVLQELQLLEEKSKN